MKFNLVQKIFLCFVVAQVIFWVILQFTGLKTTHWNYAYSLTYGFIPFLGGLFALHRAIPWGGIKSSVGRTILFISVGSIMWGIGSLTWSYYNFFEHVAVPYPSLSDVGFILAIPFWLIGMINLSKATATGLALRHKKGKILLALIPLAVIAFSYFMLVTIARSGVITDSYTNLLKVFFDFAYPVGDVAILTTSLLIFGLSFKNFGGNYKKDILILLVGYGCMYVADFLFSYRTTLGIYFNGDISDGFFTLALSLMILGIYGFQLKKQKK